MHASARLSLNSGLVPAGPWLRFPSVLSRDGQLEGLSLALRPAQGGSLFGHEVLKIKAG